MLYFLIVNYNSSELIQRLINSLESEDLSKIAILIINNSLEDHDIFKLEAANSRLDIITAPKNLGFGSACNLGLNWIYSRDRQAIVWLINPDAYFEKTLSNSEVTSSADKTRSGDAIAFFYNHPEISILGTVVYDCQGKITSAGGTFTPGTAALATLTSLPDNLTQDYFFSDWVSGCSMLINLPNFAECPSFDLRYFLYYEDLDFCLRYSQQGHKIAVTPLLKVCHDISSITDRNLFTKYQYVTKSYLIHIEKHASFPIFILTNLRMLLNTFRLLICRPQEGLGKLIGIYQYWRTRFINVEDRNLI